METLDEKLKAAIRTHGKKHGLEDLEADILMCGKTISVHQRKGPAIYVTPKLTWAESADPKDAGAIPIRTQWGSYSLCWMLNRVDKSFARYWMIHYEKHPKDIDQ